MTSSARFWNRVAKRYAAKPIADVASYRRKLLMSREYFTPTTRLLELGCGTGGTAIAHAPFVLHVEAIDVSSAMIEMARAKAAVAGLGNITFFCESVEDFTLDRGADAVLALSLLHLVDDRDATIRKAFDLLVPGGVFISSTPCLADDMPLMAIVSPVAAFLGLIPPLNHFSKVELLSALTGSGFVVEQEWKPGKGKAVFIVARKPAGVTVMTQ